MEYYQYTIILFVGFIGTVSFSMAKEYVEIGYMNRKKEK